MKRSSSKSSPSLQAPSEKSAADSPSRPTSGQSRVAVTVSKAIAPETKTGSGSDLTGDGISASKPRVMHFRSQLSKPLALRPSLARTSQLPPWAAPFFATVPALLLGAVVIAGGSHQLPEPPQAPQVVAQVAPTDDLLRLPLSRTLLVKSEASSGSVVLRGRVQPQAQLLGLAGDTPESGLSNGHAGVNGTIEKVWVKPGDFVQAGQMLVQISTGAAVRPAPRTEAAQSKAEAAQVAAAQQQDALDQRLADAQTRLSAAQQRVKQAQTKVAQARDIVRHLQLHGAEDPGTPGTVSPTPGLPDTVIHPTTPAPTTHQVAPTPSPRTPAASAPDNAQRDASQRERDALLRDARRLNEDADAAEQRAKSAQADAIKADDEARTSKAKIADLQTKVQTMQKAFDVGGAKGSDVEGARAAVEDAQNDANEAATRAVVSRQEAEQFRTKAQTLRSRAQDAQTRATASLRKLQLFGDDAQQPPAPSNTAPNSINSSPSAKRRRRKTRKNRTMTALPVPLPAPNAPVLPPHGAESSATTSNTKGHNADMTVQDAAKLVRSAVAESEAAAADAHRIELEVADYKKRVAATAKNLNSSSEELRYTQNQVLATGVRTMITTVHAKTAGIVQSVSHIAQNVGPDDIVFTVEPVVPGVSRRQRSAQPRILEARLPDPSGVWRTLKPGRTLSALLVAPSAVEAPPKASALLKAAHPHDGGSRAFAAPHSSGTRQGTSSQHAPHLASGAINSGVKLHSAQLPPHRVSPGEHPVLAGAKGPHAGMPPQKAVAPSPTLPAGSSAAALVKSLTSKAAPGISVMLKVRDVAPPTHPGDPAIVRAAVSYQAPTGSDTSKLLGSGAGVLCSVPKPGGRSAMRVPVSAIWRDARGTAKIAVLRVLPAPSPTHSMGEQPASGAPASPAPTPQSVSSVPPFRGAPLPAQPSASGLTQSGGLPPVGSLPLPSATVPPADKVALVEWHTVVTGSSDGVLQEIVSGLDQGDRIVLDPQLLLSNTTIPVADGVTGAEDTSGGDGMVAPPTSGVSTPEAPAGIATPNGQEMQPTRAERVLLVRL